MHCFQLRASVLFLRPSLADQHKKKKPLVKPTLIKMLTCHLSHGIVCVCVCVLYSIYLSQQIFQLLITWF